MISATNSYPPLEGTRPDSTLRAHAQSVLRNAILNGQFKVGQKLIERELCELTGASRSILREALVNLEANGLIERQSYRGFTVTRISPRKVNEIFELRATLETLAAELFTERASEQEIAELREVMVELEACVAEFEIGVEFEIGRMRTAKERYYNILFTGCRNNEIRRALENVIDRIYYLRSKTLMDAERRNVSLEEMRRLTTALVNRDRLAARAACAAHIIAARDTVLHLMARENDS